MTHIKKIKIYQFCVCEEIHDKTSWNWGSYWNCVLLEILSVLSILCSSHFVQGLQVRGECKIISQKWEASERRVWSPSVHQQAASMCVQNTTFQHIVSRLHALLGPSVSSPWHQSQHNHLTVRSTFFFFSQVCWTSAISLSELRTHPSTASILMAICYHFFPSSQM